MAIKEVLELIGSDVVIKQLGDVKKAGEDTLASFNKPLPELKFPELKPPDPKPIQEFAGHTVKLKDALHTLRPVMQAAGVQFGEFGAFARLATGNIVLLATAVAGAITVGLAKLGENAARTKGQLDDAFGKPGAGQQAFTALGKQAKEFGTTIDGLAPGLEAFQTALSAIDRTAKGFVALKAEDLPGAQLAKNADATATAYGNFIKLLRAGRQTQDEAQKSAKAFFDIFKDGGPLTSAALKALPVGTVEQLKQALGLAGVTAQTFFSIVDDGQISIDKFQQALINFTPQAQKAFDEKAIKTFGDELGKLGVTFTQGLPNITKGAAAIVTGFIGILGSIIKPVVLTIEDLSQKVLDIIAKAQLLSGAFVGPTLEQAGKIAPGAAAPFPTPEQAGKAGEEAAKAFVNSSGQVIGKSAPQLGDEFTTTFGKTITNKFTTEPLKLPEFDKTEAEKSFDDVLKELSDKTQEFATKPLLPEGLGFKIGLLPVIVEATVAAKKVFDDFVDGIKAKWEELNQLKRPDLPVPLPGPGAPRGGLPLLTATPGLALLQSLFGGGDQAAQAPAVDSATLVTPFQAAADRIKTIWTDLAAFITTTVTSIDLSGVTQALVTPFQTAVPQIQGIIQQVLQSVQQLNQAIQQALQGAGQLGGFRGFGGQAAGAPFASGGIVRGPGSTTSDSILAWLSNREFVVNAKAVSHYGPDFFAALNAMRLPQNFNMGGMARMMAGNKFAAGGTVKGNPVILKIDRQSFNMSAGDDTIAQIKRFAVASQLSSTGRKPRWVK